MSLIGRRIGNYEIKAKIGEGGMGTVYLGEHPLIGKRVAIKVLLEELVAKQDVVSRFFNEAKAVNDIGHVNIVDIVDFGKTQGERGEDVVYFIMEFLDGEALATRIRRAGLPFKETLHIVEQCCSALSASHKKGIVHRDLKPENLFLVPRGGDPSFVKILDFGIAKLTSGDGASPSHKTRTGLVIGTPTYMSPEQCEGKGLIDHRSDVYSLGVVMYELLTGAVPFPGEGFGEVLVAHLTKPPPPPSTLNPNLPPSLEAIVLHALEKDKNRRFQTMDEFAAAVADPEAHLRSWRALPDYATASAPTMQSMPAVGAKSGRTIALDDGAPPATLSGSPRPTTLEGAAAEVTLPPTRVPRNRAPLLALGAAVVAVVAAGGWLALSGGVAKKGGDGTTAAVATPATPAMVEQAKPAPATPPPNDEITIVVASDPPGAIVQKADRPENDTQTTPVTYKMHRGDAPFDIKLRLDGYVPQQRTIKSDESLKLLVSLAKLPAVAPPPAGNAQPAKTSSSHVSNVAKPKHKSTRSPAAKPGIDDDGNGIITPSF